MDTVIIATAQRIAGPFLRLSLAITLAWIGALKFVDPTRAHRPSATAVFA